MGVVAATLAAVVVLGVVVSVVLLVRSHDGDEGSVAQVTAYTARARPGTTTDQLLALEGQIVGAQTVASPGTGLPDVAAFHRAGVAAMRIDAATLTVTFLDDTTQK